MRRALPIWAMLWWLLLPAQGQAQTIVRVWHAYTGQEELALREAVARFAKLEPKAQVELLSIPFSSYASKLESSIAVGRGPDLFIDAHERLPVYLERKLISKIERDEARASFEPAHLSALSAQGALYATPLSLKAAVLFVNTDLVAHPEALSALSDLITQGPAKKNAPYGLVFQADDPYYLAGLLHAEGAGLLDARGQYQFVGPGAQKVLSTLRKWTEQGAMPDDPSGDLVKRLFAGGQAKAMLGGPWLATDFPAGLHWSARTIPAVERGGKPARPFVTIEAMFRASVRKTSVEREALLSRLETFLALGEGAEIRATRGGQVIAARGVGEARQTLLSRVVREQAAVGMPMPTHPNMRRVWEPAQRAAKRALRGDPNITASLELGQSLFRESIRPLPPKRSTTPLLILLSLFSVAGALLLIERGRRPDFRRALKESLPAYAYVTHAVVVVLLLVVAPLVVGGLTSLYAGRGNDLYFVGLANYEDILSARGGPWFVPGSFWFVLAVTVLWTVCNLVLHVTVGVALALLLQRVTPGLSRMYRVILILPWAVPSYVTALSWKGMFHHQFGAINGILRALGAEPIHWFARWSTAFAANVATNAWLGFPFMMVVTLGALAAIPKDLYEAAQVDGASELDQLRMITLPLIRPMLVPAMAMGAVWTFNMFNVVFLVSGGEPEGSTEILVSEAYRWAFTRSSQYGYAAAYAVLIFGLLVLGTRLLDRVSKAWST